MTKTTHVVIQQKTIKDVLLMNAYETKLSGVIILEPRRFGDDRGWFCETWNKQTLEDLDIKLDFVQDNHSFSAEKGTIRGLHFQSPPHAQDKLVRTTRGALLDVVVDIRKGSPTYGLWLSEELSAENGKQLLVPKGFLHGFVTLTENTEVQYKCTDFYAPECDGNVYFNDPDLALDWGIDANKAVLSDKDAKAPMFKDFDSPFEFEG